MQLDQLFPGNGNGHDNGNNDDCLIPFTECWCTNHPNHKFCENDTPAADISSFIFIGIIVALFMGIYSKSKIKRFKRF